MRPPAVLTSCLAALACGQPFWTPHSGPVPIHDARHALVGTWTIRLSIDTIDSSRTDENGRIVAWRHHVSTLPTVSGSLEFLDSLTKDRDALYARVGGSFAEFLCFRAPLIAFGVSRKHDRIELIQPYVFGADTWNDVFSATGQYRADSIAGTWDETCTRGVLQHGRFSMRREHSV